eukprot:COSAG01_NODE_175_length_22996_cov_18.857892_12_plen_42_part_00
MSVMDDESVAFATTSDDILSPLVPPLCSYTKCNQTSLDVTR